MSTIPNPPTLEFREMDLATHAEHYSINIPWIPNEIWT
jgi:hypothetical protein